MTSIRCYGLSAPESDARVLERYREFEGLPDLDVSKVAKCLELCGRFKTAVDIGAHIGAVTTYLARKFDKVIAFEAVPATFKYLTRNTAKLGNVTALNVALAADSGNLYFTHYPRHGQLSHPVGQTRQPKTELTGPVPARPLDSFELPAISFVKIDVEGFELPVVEGAVETLRRCRPLVLIEQAGNDEKHFGRRRNEASALLEELGMRRHSHAPEMKNDRLYTF